MRKIAAPLTLLLSLAASGLYAQSPVLGLSKSDVIVTAENDGYHLFVRQVPGAASVLLSESFEPPEHKLPTYAFRAVGPNFNDNEKRLLNGKFLPQPHHSLISSTPVPYAALGQAFEVVIPHVVEYGNTDAPNARYGKVDVRAALSSGSSFWFSIRVFAKPYADYAGAYQETAFDLKSFVKQVYVPTSDHYEVGLEEGFSKFGKAYRSADIDDAIAHIRQLLDRPGDSIDVVVGIDTTQSMVKNLEAIKTKLVAPFREAASRFKTLRLGLVLYRDYMEDYLTRDVPLTTDLDQVQSQLNQAVADGGGDIPEAVVEAFWAGLNEFDWQSPDNRMMILMGDAPQHPTPRGNVTETMVLTKASEVHVELQPIMLPQTVF
jgi:hypothetical protein